MEKATAAIEQHTRRDCDKTTSELEAIAAKYAINISTIDLRRIRYEKLPAEQQPQEPYCCEYRNQHGQQRHLMQCFCECDDLDECVGDSCCCKSASGSRIHQIRRIVRTATDRVRIPWPGGAIKIDCGVPLAFAGLGSWYWLCQLSPASVTISAFLQVLVLSALGGLHVVSLAVEWRTKFFLCWICLSIAVLYYQFWVEIMPACSNTYTALLHVLLFAMLASLFLATHSQPRHRASVADSEVRGSYCRICQAWVFGRDHHCVWLDDCVGAHNHRVFLCFLCTFALLASQFAWLGSNGHFAPTSQPLLQSTTWYAGLSSVAVWLLLAGQLWQVSINRLACESIAIAKRTRQLQRRYDEFTKSPRLREERDREQYY